MNRSWMNLRPSSQFACGELAILCLALAFYLSSTASAGDDLQVEITFDPPAAAAPAESGKKPLQPSLDEQFATFEERLQTEPAQNVIREAVVLLREKPGDATKQYFALVDDWLKDALKADPKSVILRLIQAELLDAEDRQEDLIAHYRELRKDPKIEGVQRAIVDNNLAYALVTRGDKKDLAEAESAIDDAIQLIAPSADLLDTRFMVRLAKGDLKAAREDVKAAIKDRESASFYFHLALLEEKAGDKDAARAAMQQAAKLKIQRNDVPPAERKTLDRLTAELGEKK